MRQLLSTLAVGCLTIGLVGCSDMNFWGSNHHDSAMNTTTTETTVTKTKPKMMATTGQSQTTTTMTNTTTTATAGTTGTTTETGDRTLFDSKRISSNFAQTMEDGDKAQLREAFENNPVGQSSSWKNDKTGVTYQVTPTKNVTYKGNEYCREYTMTDSKGAQKQGIACRSAKGATWVPAS